MPNSQDALIQRTRSLGLAADEIRCAFVRPPFGYEDAATCVRHGALDAVSHTENLNKDTPATTSAWFTNQRHAGHNFLAGQIITTGNENDAGRLKRHPDREIRSGRDRLVALDTLDCPQTKPRRIGQVGLRPSNQCPCGPNLRRGKLHVKTLAHQRAAKKGAKTCRAPVMCYVRPFGTFYAAFCRRAPQATRKVEQRTNDFNKEKKP